MPRKALPMLLDCPQVKVFRAVENVLRQDQVLRQVIRESNWRSFDGTPETRAPMGKNQTPAITLSRGFTPSLTVISWIALIISSLAMVMIAKAVSGTLRPSFCASFSSTRCAASASSCMRPPAKRSTGR